MPTDDWQIESDVRSRVLWCYAMIPWSSWTGRRHAERAVRQHAWQAWYLGWLIIAIGLCGMAGELMLGAIGMASVVHDTTRLLLLGCGMLWIWAVWRVSVGKRGRLPILARRARQRERR